MSLSFEMFFRLPVLKTFFCRLRLYNVFQPKLPKGHFWEIGKRGYPIKKIRSLLRKECSILEERIPPLNSYHHFFVMEKK